MRSTTNEHLIGAPSSDPWDIQSLAHIGLWEWNLVSDELRWSRKIYDMLGLSPDTIMPSYDAYTAMVLEADRALLERDLNGAIKEGRAYQNEHRLIRADGGIRYVRALGEVYHDSEGRPTYILGTLLDVTEQQEREQWITVSRDKLRNLTARRDNDWDQERRELANEIHDDLGQALTAIKLDLSGVIRSLPGSDQAQHLRKVCETIDYTIDRMRGIAAGLRPMVLEDLGLEAALESELKEFAQRGGFTYTLHTDLNEPSADPRTGTVICKVLREALTNVLRHAEAGHVDVSLHSDSDRIELQVEDNGRGIREDELSSIHALGLASMRERAGNVGGRVHIDNVDGQRGTRVRLTVAREQQP